MLLTATWLTPPIPHVDAHRCDDGLNQAYREQEDGAWIDDTSDMTIWRELGPDEIDIPAPLVSMVYVRKGEKKPFCPMWKRAIAKAQAKAAEGGK